MASSGLDDKDPRKKVSAKGGPGASQSSVSDSGNPYQWVFENLQDIFFHTDLAGNILAASPSAQRLMQFQIEEIIGRNIRTFSPMPKMFDRLAKIVLERDFVEKFEVQLRRKDGSLFWVAIHAVIRRNTQGAAVGIDGIYRDISIRKNFEEAFRQTETRYRAIFDNMRDGVAVYQALDNGNDFVIVDFNVAGERIDKVRRDQIIGKSVLQVFPGVKEFGLFDTLKRVWCTGIPEDRPAAIYQDYRLRGWRENFVYKLPSGEVVAIYSDVTERMIANQAMRESEERYRLLFDNLGEAIFVHDASGRIVDANKIACERLNYPHAEIIKMSLSDIDAGGHFLQMREKMEAIGRSEHLSYETAYQCRDQRIFPVEIISRMVDFGSRSLILSVVRDITERKRAQAAMEKANKQLMRWATIDGLTQIANRRRFDEKLHEEWGRLKRGFPRGPLSLIMCDVDYFKRYNDTYGHLAGDDCLRAIAAVMRQSVRRPADLVARYGGEEFVMILPTTNLNGAAKIAESIRIAVRNLKIEHISSTVNRYVTVSLGVAEAYPSDQFKPELLVETADQAMYAAKRRGRNCVVLKIVNPTPDAAA